MRRFLSLTPFAFAAQASALGQGLQPLQARDDVGTLTACLDNAKVPYVDDKSDGWADDIKPQNLRLPYTPHAIVYPTTTEEIQNAVRCGAEHELKVAPKSGGHSYASYGLGGEDGHLVIQLDHMYGVDLKDDNTAVIKAGTRLGYASLELYDQGKRDIPHGTCPR